MTDKVNIKTKGRNVTLSSIYRSVGTYSALKPYLQYPENTHHRGEHHCTADLRFDWFGFDQTSKADANST